VSLAAVVLYAAQSLGRVRLADRLSGDRWSWASLGGGVVVGMFLSYSLIIAWLFLKSPRTKPEVSLILLMLIGPLLVTLVVSISRFTDVPIRWVFAIVGIPPGMLIGFGLVLQREFVDSMRRIFPRIARTLLPKRSPQ